MGKRIIVTGGSGKAGQYIIPSLLAQGHEVLNLDLVTLHQFSKDVHTIKVDLTDSGQVFNAISSHFKLTQPFHSPLIQAPDAVIHLAGYARNMIVADNETFRGNIIGTYNVVEAACKLGVKKIILASSVCVYGVTFAEGDVDFPSFPIDEALDVDPMDTYAISKVCCERLGRGFARRFGVDVYALRIGALVAPNEYAEIFAQYVHRPEDWKVHGWSYIDARDLGQICNLCVMKDGLGFQIFNATNDEITNYRKTAEFLRGVCPNTNFTREMGPSEAPFSNRKLKCLLEFKEEHNWRQHYKSPSSDQRNKE
jgi:nucleoside-diphosphate-sugar epimerase